MRDSQLKLSHSFKSWKYPDNFFLPQKIVTRLNESNGTNSKLKKKKKKITKTAKKTLNVHWILRNFFIQTQLIRTHSNQIIVIYLQMDKINVLIKKIYMFKRIPSKYTMLHAKLGFFLYKTIFFIAFKDHKIF